MKTPSSENPLSTILHRRPAAKAFTLMETVIAIGVLAVLLTGFIAVFTPAAQGIRRSISAQQADRLTTTLERELVTLRKDQEAVTIKTGFDKAFDWIDKANSAADAIFVYQYRGDLSQPLRDDGTPAPQDKVAGQPGIDYTIQSIARRASEPEFADDLLAIEGAIFYVKPTQLIYSSNEMVLNLDKNIKNPTPLPIRVPPYPQLPTAAEDYSEAVIAFSAEFFSVPSKSLNYLNGPDFGTRFNTATRPVFSRNLAVRR